jgi:hypothetical protein
MRTKLTLEHRGCDGPAIAVAGYNASNAPFKALYRARLLISPTRPTSPFAKRPSSAPSYKSIGGDLRAMRQNVWGGKSDYSIRTESLGSAELENFERLAKECSKYLSTLLSESLNFNKQLSLQAWEVREK